MRVGPAIFWNRISLLMILETPSEKAPICSWMYMRKVSEDQRPILRMVSRGTSFRERAGYEQRIFAVPFRLLTHTRTMDGEKLVTPRRR